MLSNECGRDCFAKKSLKFALSAFVASLLALVIGSSIQRAFVYGVEGESAKPNQSLQKQAIAKLEDVGGQFTYSKTNPDKVVELIFTDNDVTDRDLSHLRHLTSLQVLDFNASGRVTDAGFSFVRSLSNLRTLNLGGTRISDAGLANLNGLQNLETLHLWLTTISDDGLQHISKLPKLTMVNLWDAQISDKGLKQLASIKTLKRICIGRSIERRFPLVIGEVSEDPDITDEGVEQLQRALPDAKIFYWNSRDTELVAKNDTKDPKPPIIERIKRESKKIEVRDVPDLGTRQQGTDWPSFLGPTGDNKSAEKNILANWPDRGPRLVWQRAIGDSHGQAVVSRGRLFFFDRHKDKCRVVCLNSETGEEIWTFLSPTDYVDQVGYGNGPRCSPVVDEDRVYAYGADGMLYCLSVLEGKEIWRVDTVKKFNVVQYFFGVGSTPIVEGDLLIVVVGGSPASQGTGRVNLSTLAGNESGIVAFDKFTGEVVYSITNTLASYASPKLATIGDRRWCFVFARGELVGFEPATGKVDFQFPWKAKFSAAVSAATPVVVGDEVFISEAYGPGSCLLKVRSGGHGIVWQDDPRRRDKAMQTHWNTPIFHDGYLYGCTGRHAIEGQIRCIEWKTGRIMWSQSGLSRSSLLYVDGHFIALGEYCELQLFKASPDKFELVDDFTLREDPENINSPPLLKYPAWSAPILSHGLLYVRGKENLFCLDCTP